MFYSSAQAPFGLFSNVVKSSILDCVDAGMTNEGGALVDQLSGEFPCHPSQPLWSEACAHSNDRCEKTVRPSKWGTGMPQFRQQSSQFAVITLDEWARYARRGGCRIWLRG